MCDCKECTCGCEEEEFEVITKEDIIQVVAEEISNGECLFCNLEVLYEMAYEKGKKDLAVESIQFYADVLEEDINE